MHARRSASASSLDLKCMCGCSNAVRRVLKPKRKTAPLRCGAPCPSESFGSWRWRVARRSAPDGPSDVRRGAREGAGVAALRASDPTPCRGGGRGAAARRADTRQPTAETGGTESGVLGVRRAEWETTRHRLRAHRSQRRERKVDAFFFTLITRSMIEAVQRLPLLLRHARWS